MTAIDATPQVYGVVGTPLYDYKGGIVHLWSDSESVLDMSLKLAVQMMGERGKDPSVVARISRAYRLAQESAHDAERYLKSLQNIFDGKGL